MRVNSHNTEFGYELIATLPYAYYHFLNGTLEGTISGPGSEPLYWFSPDHQINPKQRSFEATNEAVKEIPNMRIHKPILDKDKWRPPPLKEHFSADAITFEKPTVCICNRYNSEWGRGPINYFDLPTLRRLFDMLIPDHTVVYVNVRGNEELEDTAHSMDLGDYDMIAREYPEVVFMNDLVDSHGGDFNEVQCRVFAGCERFITMNGGHSILCSYFGGENIIYSKECRELWPNINSFNNWYPDLGGSIIKVVHTYDDLCAIVFSKWVAKDPLINILVRCHRREQGIERLYSSLKGQLYRNWNVIASYHDDDTFRFICKYPFYKVRVHPYAVGAPPGGPDYAAPLAANRYLNELARHVRSGYVMYLDDDDIIAPNGLANIASELHPDQTTIWRTMSGQKLIPSNENWGKIVAGDISGISFAFHSQHLGSVEWEPWRRGDYRVIRDLAKMLDINWVDRVNTIIMKSPPERGTAAYINRKAEEDKAKFDRIRAEVAERMANKKSPSQG